MKRVSFFNTYALILFSLALVLNLVYFLFLHGRTYESYQHNFMGDVAYSLYKSGSTKINQQRMGTAWKDAKQGVLGSYVEIDRKGIYQEAHEAFPSFRTIGYGLVIGSLWKLTHSLNFIDVQVLQILLYAFLMFFIFQIAFMLFGSIQAAFTCGLVHLLYLPLIYLNVQLTYDIWVYYGTVVLAYGFLRYIHGLSGMMSFLVAAFFVSFCQFIRPHIFIAVLMFCMLSLVGALFHYCSLRKAMTMIGCLFVSNVLFFWVPYISFNLKTYGTITAGPLGQVLIEGGLGQYENPWGYKCDDGWFARFMRTKYNVKYMTPECDVKARELFWESIKQYPFAYIKNISRNLAYCLLPKFNFRRPTYVSSIGGVKQRIHRWLSLSWMDKTRRISEFPFVRLFEILYVYLFMFLFYMGVAWAFAKKNYLALLTLCGGVIFSSYYVIFIHIENRFILSYYWPVPLFAGYFVSEYHVTRGWLNRWFT